MPEDGCCPQDVVDIVRRCLDRDPNARPTAKEVVDVLTKVMDSLGGEQQHQASCQLYVQRIQQYQQQQASPQSNYQPSQGFPQQYQQQYQANVQPSYQSFQSGQGYY